MKTIGSLRGFIPTVYLFVYTTKRTNLKAEGKRKQIPPNFLKNEPFLPGG